MATRFRLANSDQTSTVDLKSGTLKLRRGTWSMRGAKAAGSFRHTPYGSQFEFSHFEPVTEVFQLTGCATEATLISALNSIEDGFEAARLWHADGYVIKSWWLEANADNENARRTLIYSAALDTLSADSTSPLLESNHMLSAVVLQRHPLWERTSYATTSNNATSCWGGKWNITNVPGVAPARIRYTTLTFDSGGTLERVWMGIRDGYTTTANFDPTWDLGASCTYENNTAGAGGIATTTISTSPTMLRRVSKTLQQHDGTNYGEYIGRYVVLLRCCVSSGCTVAVRLKQGYADSVYCAPNEIAYVDNVTPNYMLKNLGVISIPAVGRAVGFATDSLQHFEIELWAELVTDSGGTDYFYMDDLCLVPADHFVHLDNMAIAGAGSPAYVITDENDTAFAYAKKASGADFHVNPEIRNWYLPAGNSMLVLAAERATSHATGDTVDVQLDYYPRYYSYRDS